MVDDQEDDWRSDIEARIEKLEYDAPAGSDVEKWNRTAWFIEQLLMEVSALRAALEAAKVPIPLSAQERANWMQAEYERLHPPERRSI